MASALQQGETQQPHIDTNTEQTHPTLTTPTSQADGPAEELEEGQTTSPPPDNDTYTSTHRSSNTTHTQDQHNTDSSIDAELIYGSSTTAAHPHAQSLNTSSSFTPSSSSSFPVRAAPYKLFVGQVPADIDIAVLRAVFSQFGELVDCVILQEKMTGKSKGCAFVTFAHQAHAEEAIHQLNDRFSFPNAKRTLIVNYAGEASKINAPPILQQQQQHQLQGHSSYLASSPSSLPSATSSHNTLMNGSNDWKLYVGQLDRASTEASVRALFGHFGHILEVFILTDRATGQSKGQGFVRFSNRDEAIAAIVGLNGLIRDGNAPGMLEVRFADGTAEKQRIMMSRGGGAGNAMMMRGGGMGMQQMNGMKSMQQQQQMLNPMMQQQMGMPVNMVMTGMGMGMGMGMQQMNPLLQQQQLNMQQMALPLQPSLPLKGGAGSELRGPEGANLFIHNIPDTYTDGDLLALFSNFGSVLSTKVARDNQTGHSKGFGFVSFDSAITATNAIQALNGFMIGSRKLTVKVKPSGTQSVAGQRYRPY